MGDHHHHHSGKNLRIAFLLNLGFTILEFVGGVFVNSIAIISDAVHDLGDSFALGFAWYLDKKSKQKPDGKYSFGYARFSLLGAAINGIILLASSIFVIYEAIQRLMTPEQSNAKGMIAFAIVGIAVNGYAAWKLSGGKTMNEKVVSWHLLEDVLGWVAILIVAVVLLFKDVPYLDPALSLAITLYILYNVIKRLRETTLIFLQGVPKDVNQQEIEDRLVELHHVDSVHHTHIWSLEGENHVFSTHVKLCHIKSLDQLRQVKEELKEVLSQYPFSNCTIETELDGETCSMEATSES
jgi:cobalt-zinc-cadmium efflux system protein